MIAQLVEKLPAGSAVALEAGRVLDETILAGFRDLGHPPLRQHADRDQGDCRRSGGRRLGRGSSPRSRPLDDRDRAEPEDDRDE